MIQKAALVVILSFVFPFMIACEHQTETTNDLNSSSGILQTVFEEPSLDSLISLLGTSLNLCLVRGGSVDIKTQVRFRSNVLPTVAAKEAEHIRGDSRTARTPIWAVVKPHNGDTVVVYLHEVRFNNTATFLLVKRGRWMVVAKGFGKV